METVSQMADGFGNWLWDKFQHLLPTTILLRIAASNGPLRSAVSDTVGWKLRQDMQFSVKSAYATRCGATAGVNEKLWSVIHKFRGLQRVKVFLWCCAKDIDHLFRKCPISVLCWSAVVKADKLDEFLSMPVHEWVLRNLSDNSYFAFVGINWDVLFGSILWNIWCNRNTVIFDKSENEAASILANSRRPTAICCTEVAVPNKVSRVLSGGRAGAASRHDAAIGSVSRSWIRPEEGWIKINTDVNFLESGSARNSCMPILLRHFEDFRFTHIRCKDNKVTDRLCDYASSLDFEIHVLKFPTDALVRLLLADAG
ncbi:hypothetical protein V6N12_015005 [Hibiscus sabdariffa]|uniref:RNase H type-1 domain-containing protein n=1 Tax=Hibiscus sabdariffa TaxID=183260 RepID=A0ABR2DLW5_9ROSI